MGHGWGCRLPECWERPLRVNPARAWNHVVSRGNGGRRCSVTTRRLGPQRADGRWRRVIWGGVWWRWSGKSRGSATARRPTQSDASRANSRKTPRSRPSVSDFLRQGHMRKSGPLPSTSGPAWCWVQRSEESAPSMEHSPGIRGRPGSKRRAGDHCPSCRATNSSGERRNTMSPATVSGVSIRVGLMTA